MPPRFKLNEKIASLAWASRFCCAQSHLQDAKVVLCKTNFCKSSKADASCMCTAFSDAATVVTHVSACRSMTADANVVISTSAYKPAYFMVTTLLCMQMLQDYMQKLGLPATTI